MRALSLLFLVASPALAQGVPTNPFASNLPSYPRPHMESVRPVPAAEMERRRTAACVGEASARGFAGRKQRAFVRHCLAG